MLPNDRDNAPPMPLKHATETLLVFILGLAIAITGFLTATLPHLPSGGLPWVVLMIIASLYPIGLLRVFRNNRADYPFRWLHWFPVLILIIWMVVELMIKAIPNLSYIRDWFSWGWTLPLVLLGFVATLAFCLHVIRRRVPRTILLLAVLVPFTVLAVMSEKSWELDNKLASVLWEGDWWTGINKNLSGTGGTQIAMDDKETKNLEESVDPEEEAWRERLRAFERRRQMIAQKNDQDEDGSDQIADDAEEQQGTEDGTVPINEETAPHTGTGREFREAQTSPTALPSSGAPIAGMSLSMLMGYFGVLHQRARKRVS